MHLIESCKICTRRLRPNAPDCVTVKGIHYWRTYELARAYALGAGVRTDRIISYCRGWAVQLEVSGNYLGEANG